MPSPYHSLMDPSPIIPYPLYMFPQAGPRGVPLPRPWSPVWALIPGMYECTLMPGPPHPP